MKKLLLCVDDERVVLEGIRSQVKRYLPKSIQLELAESAEDALEILDEYLQKKRKAATLKLQEQSSVGKFSSDLNDIIPAALEGRIESLFVQKSKDRYGLYDKINRSLIIDTYN